MSEARHKYQGPNEGVHVAYNWQVADRTDLDQIVSNLIAESLINPELDLNKELYKFAHVLEDNTLWMLISVASSALIKWKLLSSGTGDDVLALLDLPLDVNLGGTGLSTVENGGLLYGNGGSALLSVLPAAGIPKTYLTSNGTIPSWTSVIDILTLSASNALITNLTSSNALITNLVSDDATIESLVNVNQLSTTSSISDLYVTSKLYINTTNIVDTTNIDLINIRDYNNTRDFNVARFINTLNTGEAGPAFTSPSTGTRIILKNSITTSSTSYAIGIDTNNVWLSLPNKTSSHSFKIYGGLDTILTINGTGSVYGTNVFSTSRFYANEAGSNTNVAYAIDSDSTGLYGTSDAVIFSVNGEDSLRVTEKAISGKSNFSSGFAGSGWRIDEISSLAAAEFDSLTVRGTMRVYELLINQIRATNGSLFVSSVAKVESHTITGTGSLQTGSIVFEDPSNNNLCPFIANDVIMMQRVQLDNTTVIKKLVYKVMSVNGKTIVVEGTTEYDNEEQLPSKGDDFVRIYNSTNTNRQGIIYLTSDDSNAPFMDIKDEITTLAKFNSFDTLKVRLGKLSGITTNNFGNLSGYGLYTSRIYLDRPTGSGLSNAIKLYADETNAKLEFINGAGKSIFDFDTALAVAKIAGWNITSSSIYSDNIYLVSGTTPYIYMGAKNTYASTASGIWIGNDGGTYKANIGNNTSYIKVDTSVGGDVEIKSDNVILSSSAFVLDSVSQYFKLGDGTVNTTTGVGIFLSGSGDFKIGSTTKYIKYIASTSAFNITSDDINISTTSASIILNNTSQSIYIGSSTAAYGNNGIFIGKSGSKYVMSIATGSEGLFYNGDNVAVYGKIFAYSGYIGTTTSHGTGDAWEISDGYIKSKKTVLSSKDEYLLFNEGTASFGSGKGLIIGKNSVASEYQIYAGNADASSYFWWTGEDTLIKSSNFFLSSSGLLWSNSGSFGGTSFSNAPILLDNSGFNMGRTKITGDTAWSSVSLITIPDSNLVSSWTGSIHSSSTTNMIVLDEATSYDYAEYIYSVTSDDIGKTYTFSGDFLENTVGEANYHTVDVEAYLNNILVDYGQYVLQTGNTNNYSSVVYISNTGSIKFKIIYRYATTNPQLS